MYEFRKRGAIPDERYQIASEKSPTPFGQSKERLHLFLAGTVPRLSSTLDCGPPGRRPSVLDCVRVPMSSLIVCLGFRKLCRIAGSGMRRFVLRGRALRVLECLVLIAAPLQVLKLGN